MSLHLDTIFDYELSHVFVLPIFCFPSVLETLVSRLSQSAISSYFSFNV